LYHVTEWINDVNIDYNFDDGNQLTGMTYTKADGTSLGNLGYTPDGELDKVAVLPQPYCPLPQQLTAFC